MDRIQRALDIARTQRPMSVPAPVARERVALRDPEEAPSRRSGEEVRGPAPPAQCQDLPGRCVPLDRRAARERRVVLSGDPDPSAHAYRMLRTLVLQQARAQQLRTIGVVSAVDGEGKTLTAANLALSIAAEPNQSVLLLDLDLKSPSVAPLLGISGEDGLEGWLAGSVTDLAATFVKLEGLERLRVLPTLQSVTGRSEVLAGARARDLLATLTHDYPQCLALIDLPPVLLADDVLTLAPLLDAILIVVAEGRTKREDVARLQELLRGVKVLGTVLNVSAESEKRAY